MLAGLASVPTWVRSRACAPKLGQVNSGAYAKRLILFIYLFIYLFNTPNGSKHIESTQIIVKEKRYTKTHNNNNNNILGSQLSPSSINLVPAQAGKVTEGLASHWPCVTDTVVYPPTGSTAKDREMSTHAYAPLGRGTIYLTSARLHEMRQQRSERILT